MTSRYKHPFRGTQIVTAIALALAGSQAACASAPLSLVTAHGPLEISGVAALPGGAGYAVVGDETASHGRIWPSGRAWKIRPDIEDLESLDVALDENGRVLWLVLGETDRLVAEPGKGGARARLPDSFREICGRGLEGLSLRRRDGEWHGVVLWEGGYLSPRSCAPDDRARQRKTPSAKPKIGFFKWRAGTGIVAPPRPVTLDAPSLPTGLFHATDIAWHGDEMIVLLGSTGKGGGPPYAHTWLQRFRPDGSRVGKPVKLEEEWGRFREGKNWEALDVSPDGRTLILGYDAKSGSTSLVLFPNPFR